MLNSEQAIAIVQKNLPGSRIQKYIPYRNLFVFQVLIDDSYEGGWDPYYSVDRLTNEFRDFSIIIDGNLTELNRLFERGEVK